MPYRPSTRVYLTDREQAFVHAYLTNGHLMADAYKAAYSYAAQSNSTIMVAARRLMKRPIIKKAIEDHFAALKEHTLVTAERITEELAKIGFADIRKAVKWGSREVVAGTNRRGEPVTVRQNVVEFIDSEKLDDSTAGAISEVSRDASGAIKVKMYDKRAALVDLGRTLSMFKDKVEVDVTGSLTVERKLLMEELTDQQLDALSALARVSQRRLLPAPDPEGS